MGIADHIKNGISRRGFVLGGAAGGRCHGACRMLRKKRATSDDAAGEPQVIKDDSKIISITDEYEAVDIDLEPAASWTLPRGYAAVLLRRRLRRGDDGTRIGAARQHTRCAQPG